MKLKQLMWAMLPVAAALALSACSSSDEASETPTAPKSGVKQIPYTVTVGSNSTRATVDDNLSDLYFAAGDQLVITGENISGTLSLISGIGDANATFEGFLNYKGQGDPAANLKLTATLKGSNQTLTADGGIDYGTALVDLSTTTLQDAIKQLVPQYSLLKGVSTFGSKDFYLTQQTAFLYFNITLDEGTYPDAKLLMKVSGVGGQERSANVVAKEVNVETGGKAIVAKFVVPVSANQTLTTAAKVTAGANDPISFVTKDNNLNGDGKVWNVPAITLQEDGVQLWANGPKWAKHNLGAANSKDTDWGNLYMWGYGVTGWPITNTSKNFSWAGYPWYVDGTGTSDLVKLTKYNDSSNCPSGSTPDNKKILDDEDDAAIQATNGKWQMPLRADVRNLVSNTNSEWKENFKGSGAHGRTFTGKGIYSHRRIFLPASGWHSGTEHHDKNVLGYYWSKELDTVHPTYAAGICFSKTMKGDDDSNPESINSWKNRFDGFCIRPVLKNN